MDKNIFYLGDAELKDVYGSNDLPDPEDFEQLLVKYIDEEIIEKEKRNSQNASVGSPCYSAFTRSNNYVSYFQKIEGRYTERIYCFRTYKGGYLRDYKEVARIIQNANIVYVKDLEYYSLSNWRTNWGDRPRKYYGGLVPLQTEWNYMENRNQIGMGRHFLNDPVGLIKGDESLKYCGYDLYQKETYYYFYFINYISYYRKLPQIEMLVKLGLSNCISYYKQVNFDGKSFLQIFGVPYSLKDDIVNYGLNTTKKAYRLGVSTYKYYMFIKEIIPAGLSKYLTPKNMSKYMEYAKKHEIIKKSYGYGSTETNRLYHDYISMAKILRKNFKDDYWLMPKDIKKAHDKVLNELNQLREQKRLARETLKLKRLEKKFEKIIKKYSRIESQIDGFALILPKSYDDFVRESDYLKHCVGRTDSYYKKMANGEALIVFVRREKTIEKPVETVEFDIKNKSIIQCRGKNNQPSKYHNQILKVVDQWKNQVFQTV